MGRNLNLNFVINTLQFTLISIGVVILSPFIVFLLIVIAVVEFIQEYKWNKRVKRVREHE